MKHTTETQPITVGIHGTMPGYDLTAAEQDAWNKANCPQGDWFMDNIVIHGLSDLLYSLQTDGTARVRIDAVDHESITLTQLPMVPTGMLTLTGFLPTPTTTHRVIDARNYPYRDSGARGPMQAWQACNEQDAFAGCIIAHSLQVGCTIDVHRLHRDGSSRVADRVTCMTVYAP